ncbi:MAG: nucleoside monophosphate kinase [Candidatus Peribacteria bacterium]|nr:MAG: nucleoside monophosphate kinase [Candidatus Peribacteria bacterium]
MYLVFIGIQGSGKGTQARLLEEKKGFKLYETGGALREISKKDTELGRLVKETIEAGNQVSPEIVEDILRDVIASNPGKDLILDGFVRNFGNKASVDKIV